MQSPIHNQNFSVQFQTQAGAPQRDTTGATGTSDLRQTEMSSKPQTTDAFKSVTIGGGPETLEMAEKNSGKAEVRGGREMRTAGAVAGKTTKKSQGFFSIIFGKINAAAKNIEQHIKGMELSTKKNLKDSFKEGGK